jgi:DNA polymerase III sliding clamp (beta) subunit (PCNA family)
LGRADSVETEVGKGSVDVAVTVPSKSLSDTVVLEVADKVYLGLSIIDDRIVFRISDGFFTYF